MARGRREEAAWLEARALALTCELCQRRMQAAADMLLLTSDPRPVRTPSLSVFGESVARLKDTVAARTKGLAVLLRDLTALVHSDRAQYAEARLCVEEMSSLVVSLTECCAHAGYLVAVLQDGSSPEAPGPVDRYQVCRAAADLEYKTALLRAHRLPTISSLLTDICISANESANVLANCCLVAADEAPDDHTREQFRLCLKSVSAAANTFCSSIKSLKDEPSDRNYKACQVFGEALATTCNALVVFATQDVRLTGEHARLDAAGGDALRRVLGACMSVVSPCVLACSLAGRLSIGERQAAASRLHQCCEAVARSSINLVHTLDVCAASGKDSTGRP